MPGSNTSLSVQHFGPLPRFASRRLCQKASEQNEELTKAERLLLLSQLNLAGKTLAYPKSLDDAQVNEVLGYPPPDVLASNVKAVTGLNSIDEVLRDYWAPDRTKQLSHEALNCIFEEWWTSHTSDIYAQDSSLPGDTEVEHAAAGLGHLLRPEQTKFEEAVSDRVDDDMDSVVDDTFEVDMRQRAQKSDAEWASIKKQYAAERRARTERLREELETQLEQELRDASQDDLAAIKALRDQMALDKVEEEREDAELAKAWEREDSEDSEDDEAGFSDDDSEMPY